MGLVKKVLWLMLWLCLAGGGLYVAQNRGLIAKLPKISLPKTLVNKLPQSSEFLTSFKINQLNLNTPENEKLLLSAQNQSQELIQKTGLVLGATQEFLQNNIKKDDRPQDLSNKALEYGRYLYCQQVVENYETKLKIRK